MKLKTLKDIDMDSWNEWSYKKEITKQLRQEAIKWIRKYFEENESSKVLALEHFFNITKEDYQ